MGGHIVLLAHSDHGHRRAHVEQFTALFKARGIDAVRCRHWARTLGDPAPLLFLMVEESFGGYVATSLWRAAFGRRTVGLLFRGGDCARGQKLRLRVKRWVLKAFKSLRNVQTIAITPFLVEPTLDQVSDGWIHDPQLWDLPADARPGSTPLSERVRDAAAGRMVMISLGVQARAKGYGAFSDLWLADPQVRRSWLFVSAGKTQAEVAGEAQALEATGAMVIDRLLTDDELLSLYGEATLLWCCYAPDYDQASGIFGRAYQFGVPIAVRATSQVDRLATLVGHPAVRLEWSGLSSAQLPSTPPKGSGRTVTVEAVRSESIATLARAFGGSLNVDRE